MNPSAWGPKGPPDLPMLRQNYVEFTDPKGFRYVIDTGLSDPELNAALALLEQAKATDVVIHRGLPSRSTLAKNVTFLSRWWA